MARITGLAIVFWAGLLLAGDERVVVADFEHAADSFSGDNCKIELSEGKAATGQRSLKATPTADNKKWRVKLPLPANSALAEYAALHAAVRVAAGAEVSLRWLAVSTKDKAIMFQRPFKLTLGADWQKLSWPLESWRWGNELTGDWPRVDALYLQVESAASAVELDDVVFTKDARGKLSAYLSAERVLELAFAKNEFRQKRDGDLLVATDALLIFSDDDLAGVMDEVKAARVWLQSFFGADYVPTNEGMPVALLIFSKKEGQAEFFTRLGELWSVDVARGAVTGYTLTSLATVVHGPEMTKKRPVFVHEAIHALVSRDLRLPTGGQRVNWLQEGLANYVQAAVHPEALKRASYIQHFARPIGENTFFKPLAKLIGERVSGEHYLQLASFVAYLATENPAALRALAKAFAAEDSAAAALKTSGLNLSELERGWFEWGKKKFAPETAQEERAFALPPGWKE